MRVEKEVKLSDHVKEDHGIWKEIDVFSLMDALSQAQKEVNEEARREGDDI